MGTPSPKWRSVRYTPLQDGSSTNCPSPFHPIYAPFFTLEKAPFFIAKAPFFNIFYLLSLSKPMLGKQ